MDKQKPLISYILITYNQESFVREALDGAFSQTYSPLEIIIADDGSMDGTVQVISEMLEDYRGPHKVAFLHGGKNVGIAKNVNKAMANANGEYFIIAAGDDKSLPERAQRTYELFTQYPDMTCINFLSIPCDSNLQPLKALSTLCTVNSISSINIYDYLEFTDFVIWSGDTRSIRRSLYDIFGDLTKSKDEDSAYFLRGLLLGSVGHSQEAMSLRRTHELQVSRWRNIKKRTSLDFVSQPFLDVQNAVKLQVITQELADKFCYKIKCADRILADQYFYATNIWYRLLYSAPVNVFRRIKNKIFR